MFCCLPNYSTLSARVVHAAARTGDLFLYRTAARCALDAPTLFASLLSHAPCAVALAGGVRDSPVDFDAVAVVIETEGSAEPELLIYHAAELLFVPMSTLDVRSACLRPLMTEQAGNDKQCRARRQAIRKLLLEAVTDLVDGRTDERAMRSPAYLAAYLLCRAGVLSTDAAAFCGELDDDIEYLFSSDAQHLDGALTQTGDYGYGHQMWIAEGTRA